MKKTYAIPPISLSCSCNHDKYVIGEEVKSNQSKKVIKKVKGVQYEKVINNQYKEVKSNQCNHDNVLDNCDCIQDTCKVKKRRHRRGKRTCKIRNVGNTKIRWFPASLVSN